MDLIGVVFVSAAVICFTLSMRWAGVQKPWSSGDVVGTLVATGVFAVAFVVNEWYQGDRAFITGKILTQTTLRTAAIFEFL
jgi:multisubunit Na+/H+ antiporter MnhB subunit